MDITITKGKIKCAKKVVIYGPEGIGKSTLAAKFPDPVFIDTEGSTNAMDIARFPKPTSWTMLLEEVDYVRQNPDVCRTLVIDTTDWAEQMCIQSICDKHQKDGIESFGYGTGYVYVREEFGRFLNKLSEVVEKGINVVLTAHAQMRKFEQPDEMGAYDRWELKLGKKTGSQTSPLVKEWCDMLLFCNYKTTVVNVDGQGARKGKNKVQGGKRVMYTSHHSCWDAKNRYGLPEEVPMEWSSIAYVFNESTPSAEESVPDKKEVPPVTVKEEKKSEEHQDPPKAEGPDVRHFMTNEDYREPPKPPEPEKPAEIPKENKTEGKPEGEIKKYFSDEEKIPKALRDLMEANDVCEWDIQAVVAAKGYYPQDTLIEKYDPGFVQGVLIGAWDQVFKMVKDYKEKQYIPFN